MPKFAANLSTLFNEVPFMERFDAAAQAGFRGVEFLFPYEYDAAQLKQALSRNQLELVLFNTAPGNTAAGEWGVSAIPGREEDARRDIDNALEYALALSAWLLGLRRGWSRDKLSDMLDRAIPSSAGVILVAGAGGAFGKVLVESGVGKALALSLETIHLPLIPAAFILSLALRASQGSATVAILTTSGLLTQAVAGISDIQLVLVTLSACFGALGLSHVNDAGFWVVTRYLGLSVADGLKTWTVLTTAMGLTGFVLVWLLSALL